MSARWRCAHRLFLSNRTLLYPAILRHAPCVWIHISIPQHHPDTQHSGARYTNTDLTEICLHFLSTLLRKDEHKHFTCIIAHALENCYNYEERIIIICFTGYTQQHIEVKSCWLSLFVNRKRIVGKQQREMLFFSLISTIWKQWKCFFYYYFFFTDF